MYCNNASPFEINKVHGYIGTFILSTLYTANNCIIILNSFVDDYGRKILDEIAARGIKVILIYDSIARRKGSVKKPRKAESYVIEQLRIHDKIYVSKSNNAVIVALSSANLLERDMFFNINHYEALVYPTECMELIRNDQTISFIESVKRNQCNKECSEAINECLKLE